MAIRGCSNQSPLMMTIQITDEQERAKTSSACMAAIDVSNL